MRDDVSARFRSAQRPEALSGRKSERRINLIEGVFPPYTAVEFQFLSGTLGSVTKDLADSSPLFEPGSILSFGADSFRLDLSGTCEQCVGITAGGPGENIVLNVAAVPEPATVALMFLGLGALTWRRRKVRSPSQVGR